jgi:hypothetical protein
MKAEQIYNFDDSGHEWKFDLNNKLTFLQVLDISLIIKFIVTNPIRKKHFV